MADVKICGLSTPETMDAAVASGARYVGFVFFDRSPRAVDAGQAKALAHRVPPGVAKVGLFVSPDDAMLQSTLADVPLDMVQLHDVSEPERLAQIRALCGLPLIIASSVETAEDVDAALSLAYPGDLTLLDAKPPKGSELPGGNGARFDWSVVSGRRMPRGWMLAGGLDPDNVGRALNLTAAPIVDVSSGVESAAGIKDPEKIEKFIRAAGSPPPILRG